MVHFGQYGPFGTTSGPSYCISVPFLFRYVLTKDQVSKEGFFSPFGPWSVLDHMVHFGQYGPFGTMSGPSYCISVLFLIRNGPYCLFRTMIGPSYLITVSFMFRNVQRQDQVSVGSFVYTFCNFHYLCAPFDPFWSIFGPLGPNYETI